MASYATAAELDCGREGKLFDSINTAVWAYSSSMIQREILYMWVILTLSCCVKLMKPLYLNCWWSSSESGGEIQFVAFPSLIGSFTAVNAVWSPESRVLSCSSVRLVFGICTLSHTAQIPPAWWQRSGTGEWERRPDSVKSPAITLGSFRENFQNTICVKALYRRKRWTTKIKRQALSKTKTTKKSFYPPFCTKTSVSFIRRR